MTMKFFLAFLIFTLTNCSNNSQHSLTVQSDSLKNLVKAVTPIVKESFEKIEIICDTVYKNKGYKLTLTLFDTTNEDETIPNTLFTLSMLTNGQYLPIYSDSIFNKVQEIHFTDFNNDKVKYPLHQPHLHFKNIAMHLCRHGNKRNKPVTHYADTYCSL